MKKKEKLMSEILRTIVDSMIPSRANLLVEDAETAGAMQNEWAEKSSSNDGESNRK